MAGKTTSHEFTVWISLMTVSAVDAVVSRLVRNGHGVSAASVNKNLYVGDENNACKLLAIDLVSDVPEAESKTPSKMKNWAFNEVKKALNDSGVMYYSAIIHSPGTGASWSEGNVIIPKNNETITTGPYR